MVRKCYRLISASQILLYKKKKSGDVKMQTLIQQFWDGALGLCISNKLPGGTDAAC